MTLGDLQYPTPCILCGQSVPRGLSTPVCPECSDRDHQLIRAAKHIVELEGLLSRWYTVFGELADGRLRRETSRALSKIPSERDSIQCKEAK
jgi:hypothetical protein